MAVPLLSKCFTMLDYSGVIDIVDHFAGHEIDESQKLNYFLHKIFEYLDSPDRREWATRDINVITRGFAKKWVHVDQNVMSDEELKMLITLACYYEYGKDQPIGRE